MKIKITPDDIETNRLMQQRKYLREHKIPALEKLFDVLKEKLGPIPPDEADPWIRDEYTDMRLTLEEIQLDICHIELRVRHLLGLTVEDLDNLEFGD